MMRRLLIVSFALPALIAIALLANVKPAAGASFPCKEVYGRAGGYVCGAGLDTRLMDFAYAPQQTQVGSFADSLAMIIAYSGGNISAGDVITALFPGTPPDTLSPDQVLPYLNHTFTSSADRSVTATTGTLLISTPIAGGKGAMRAIANQLTNEMPLLVFTSHNAMVLTAIYYYADLLGHPLRPYAVVVRDPVPNQQPSMVPGESLDGRPGARFLPLADFNGIDHVFTVTVAQH
jgi:hypothetical protein